MLYLKIVKLNPTIMEKEIKRDSLEFLVWLTGEQPTEEDKQKLIELDKERIQAMRDLTQMQEVSKLIFILDYAIVEYSASKYFHTSTNLEGRRGELFDLNHIRDLLYKIGELEMKSDIVEEPYKERWRARNGRKLETA